MSDRELAARTGSAESEFANAAVMLWGIQRRMVRGCLNHGCRISKPIGMATNGPCTCSARQFARELRDIADMLSPNAQRERPADGGEK